MNETSLLSKRKLVFWKKLLPIAMHKGEFRKKEAVPLRPRFGICHPPDLGDVPEGFCLE